MLDKFELVASLDRDAFGLDYGGEPEKKLLYIGFQSQQTTPYINVKAKVEMLEAVHPGLGRTAVSIAELAGYRTFTAFTPQVALHHASYLYWCGTDNDEDFKDKLEFGKLSTEDYPELAGENNVQGIPCMIFFKNGKEVNRIVGFAPKAVMKAKIKSVLDSV